MGKRAHQPALLQHVFEHACGQQGNACALSGGLGQRQRRVEHGSARQRGCLVQAGKPAFPFLSAIGAQQGLPGQVGRLAQLLCQHGSAHGRKRSAQQHLSVRAMPGTVAKAHGSVQSFTGQIHAIVIGQQAEVYIGMQLLELA